MLLGQDKRKALRVTWLHGTRYSRPYIRRVTILVAFHAHTNTTPAGVYTAYTLCCLFARLGLSASTSWTLL